MIRAHEDDSNGVATGERDPKRARTEAGPLDEDRTARDAALGTEDNSGRRRVVTRADHHDKNKILKPTLQGSGTELYINKLDLHETENRQQHHSSEYEHTKLIVRRGQGFKVTVTFDRPLDFANEKVILQMVYGTRPKESKGTVLRLPLVAEEPTSAERWHAKYLSQAENSVDVTITSPADAIIGTYRIFVETVVFINGVRHLNRQEFDDELVMLFNPWCEKDDVYLADEKERDEYCMNESGRIWTGTCRAYGGMPWNFGQFEDVCLDVALYLLDRAELADGARANPVFVVRCISAMSNSNDADGGVLTGRWTETYPKNSTVPWAWTGSVAILEEFMKKHKRAVRYGQCWVFSGIVTTLLRALGIPTRSVTNFESAHDTDASMTIDYHWNEDDEPLDDLNDSIWNFHVWNESWFKRTDLPEGYDGWQAHDATPQEVSEGIMRCGPASVKAIKEGLVYLPYDAPFIFSEVNGDKVHWLVNEDGEYKCIYKEKQVIGLKISTKSVSNNRRRDLCKYYKHPENSEEERKAVRRAFRYSSRREYDVYDAPEPQVEFELVVPECVTIGSDFRVHAKLKNLVDEDHEVKFRVTMVMAYYTGVPGERIMTESYVKTLSGKQDLDIPVDVSVDVYQKLVKQEAAVQVFLRGTVLKTGQSYAHQENFALMKPDLDVTAPDSVVKAEEFTIKMKLKNPLKEELTGGEFSITAPGITKTMTIKHKAAIKPGEEVEEEATLTATKAGTKEIIVRFSSDQLSGLSGTCEVIVSYGE